MTLVNVARAAILGALLLIVVGLLLQVGGVGDDRFFFGLLYGGIALMSGGSLLIGYASGRWPPPDQRDPAARRWKGRLAAVWSPLALVLMVASRILFDGMSIGDAVAQVATASLRFGGFPLAALLVGYVIGRILRNGQAPART